jgi:hypothetical protein
MPLSSQKNIPITCNCLSIASCILSIKVWEAVSVDLFFPNRFCTSVNMVYLVTNDISLLYTSLSSIFEKTDKADIGP